MKKNIIIIMLSLVILTGCGNYSTSINIEETSSIIENKLSNMEKVEDSTLTDVYGLDLSLMEEFVVKQNDFGDLYAIIKAKNNSEVKRNMAEYFEKIKQFNAAYSPERLKILENRIEREIGSYLIYIVSEDCESIYEDILGTL